MRVFYFFLMVTVLSLSGASVHAQTQYNNRVVVIPLQGDDPVWRGPWADATEYAEADLVEFDGSSYISIEKHTSDLSNIPPDITYWELVAASGATGAQGPQGEEGPAGEDGVDGDQGPIGLTGPEGPQGPQGMKGDMGDQGPVGMTGPEGPQGPQGMKGDMGDQGPIGMTGPEGPQGPQGMKGDTGDQGPIGMTGPEGPMGPMGSMGPMGMPGMNGTNGTNGMDGATGPAGADGSAFPPDGVTTFEITPDPVNAPDDKVISGISYAAGRGIAITTPDAMKPNEKQIRFTTNNITQSLREYTNYQPSLGMHYVIALQGVFPSRNFGPDDYIASVEVFGGNFAPRGWALCEGQLLPISQNSALFSIIGTTYGGDGRTTFGLPDLRGRTPVGVGRGPGLSDIRWGQKLGSETILINIP